MVHHLSWIMIVLNSLAVYRVSMIIARDTISEKPRAALARRYDGSLVTLVNCVWCLSVWIGAAAAAMTYYFWYDGWMWVAAALSFSAVSGYLSEHS